MDLEICFEICFICVCANILCKCNTVNFTVINKTRGECICSNERDGGGKMWERIAKGIFLELVAIVATVCESGTRQRLSRPIREC